MLTQFPARRHATLVVQHMPEKFTASFAARLNAQCNVEVKEAEDGDHVVDGRVLLAPGGHHMVLRKAGERYFVQLKDGPPVYHQRPSVEVMFDSVTKCAAKMAVGAILTGMGADGARALLAMRQAGARTLAQDERTSVVWGMPGEAVKCGAAERVVPLDDVTSHLMEMSHFTSSGQSHRAA
ncbi:MAG: CheB methylesterase domain-containing protein [Rubrivivax sp.]